MKTRIETVEVREEAYTYERKFYGCEACEFESESEDEFKAHYGSKHTVKGEKKIGTIVFRLFDSEADLGAYCDAQNDRDHSDTMHSGRWEGPGWYGEEHSSGPCGRGCCTRYYAALLPTTHFKNEWEKKLSEVTTALTELATLKGEAQ
jgi:hypothetical protein